MLGLFFTDPEQAREAISTALAYLVNEDGYQREDLEEFVRYEITLLYED